MSGSVRSNAEVWVRHDVRRTCGQAVLFALAIALSGPAAARDAPSLFGTTEIRSPNIKPFPKWTDMLSRHFTEEKRGDTPCMATRFVPLIYEMLNY